MAKVLIIKASPKGEMGMSNELVKTFMREYMTLNPTDSITIKDISDINFINFDSEVLKFRSSNIIVNDDKKNILEQYDMLVDEFIEYDKYIFAFPNWNLLVPPNLVAYVLWVFRRSSLINLEGESILNSRKALLIYTSGGNTKSETDTSFGLEWMKAIMNKYGMGETVTFNAHKLEGEEELTKQRVKRYKEKIKEIAQTY